MARLSPSLSPATAGCRTRRRPRSLACASAATPSESIGPTRCEDRSIGSSRRKWRKIAPRRTLKRHRLAKRHQIGPGAPQICEPVGRRDGDATKRKRRRRGIRPASAFPLAANPSSALNLANGKPRLRPFHLVVRETEFCGLRLAGDFGAQNAGERSEFGSQTATPLTNRPELRGFLSTRKPRWFAETAWWAMQGSN